MTSDTPIVQVRDIVKAFGTQAHSVLALDHLSLDVGRGEILVLLGPSGCGKTTLLRSIAGLEIPNDGEIRILDQPVFSGPGGISVLPERRQIGMVFQSYALWPHLTVFDNVAYPLRTRGRMARDDLGGAVRTALELVGCGQLAERYPGQLSGGQQQRVALARALVGDQRLILFDEPLSNVDAKVREQLRAELVAMQRRLGFTAIYVTHDQVEAMVVASRIAVMRAGKIVQIGTPTEIYHTPRTRYVADFVGSANFLPGTVKGQEEGVVILDSPIGEVWATSGDHDYAPGSTVTIFFRPENCTISATSGNSSGQSNEWSCKLELSVFLGAYHEHMLTAQGQKLTAWSTAPTAPVGPDGRLILKVDPSCVRLVDHD